MTLKSKNYLIFQITIPIVTFIVMALSHIIYPPSFVLRNEILKAAPYSRFIHQLYFQSHRLSPGKYGKAKIGIVFRLLC